MLETVSIDQTIASETYESVFPQLEMRLGELQREARTMGLPVIVVFEGWEASGKGTHINRLIQPLDPRGFKVWAIQPQTLEEQHHPFLWRFWLKLPANGFISIFDKSWYGRVLHERVEKLVPRKVWKEAYNDILNFERLLTDDEAVIVKIWLHIDKDEQRRRFKKISKDVAESWKISKEDWRQHKKYDEYLLAVEEMMEKTSTAAAPWTIVKTHDRRFARVRIFQTLITAIEDGIKKRQLKQQERKLFEQVAKEVIPEENAVAPLPPVLTSTVLNTVDLTRTLTREDYEKQLAALQQRFRDLEHQIYVERIPVIITYEGWDAAGKGGNIKRLTDKLDPRGYEVIPIAAPTGEEKVRHYLWRFWRHIPKAGHITIFDRTWYGRVLVERIEGFCRVSDWQRAFREINEFEAALANYGTVIVKFWLHIDQEEQLRRFNERQNTTAKLWKITDEDWRNREKWADYERAVSEMIERTSTTYAPWTIVESVDKLYARVKALRTVVNAIETALDKRRK